MHDSHPSEYAEDIDPAVEIGVEVAKTTSGPSDPKVETVSSENEH